MVKDGSHQFRFLFSDFPTFLAFSNTATKLPLMVKPLSCGFSLTQLLVIASLHPINIIDFFCQSASNKYDHQLTQFRQLPVTKIVVL